jgi:hypothetical protein
MEHTEKAENINSYNEDYFKARFKKKMFGGYNPTEVIDFINAMTSNFQSSDQNLRKNIMKLTQDKQTAENELHTLKSEQSNHIQEMKQEMDVLLEEQNQKKQHHREQRIPSRRIHPETGRRHRGFRKDHHGAQERKGCSRSQAAGGKGQES